MKKVNSKLLIASLSVLLALSTTTFQSEDVGLADVKRIEGKYIFFMSEPVADYEEVMRVKPPAIAIGENKIEDVVSNTINRINRKLKRQKKEWDAFITVDGVRGRAIKFK